MRGLVCLKGCITKQTFQKLKCGNRQIRQLRFRCSPAIIVRRGGSDTLEVSSQMRKDFVAWASRPVSSDDAKETGGECTVAVEADLRKKTLSRTHTEELYQDDVVTV